MSGVVPFVRSSRAPLLPADGKRQRPFKAVPHWQRETVSRPLTVAGIGAWHVPSSESPDTVVKTTGYQADGPVSA